MHPLELRFEFLPLKLEWLDWRRGGFLPIDGWVSQLLLEQVDKDTCNGVQNSSAELRDWHSQVLVLDIVKLGTHRWRQAEEDMALALLCEAVQTGLSSFLPTVYCSAYPLVELASIAYCFYPLSAPSPTAFPFLFGEEWPARSPE